MSEHPPAIVVSELHKSYGTYEAVRGISFEVQQGEVFGFLGPNGAGKTTTIEILEGYRPRTGGDISILGMDPAKRPRELRERVGLVLQESELDPNLTVRETLRMFAGFFPAPRRVDETIALVGLAEKAGALIGGLSGGQKRRADVAVGLIGDPEVLFLDEPTTGFDPSARRDAWNMIEGLKELGKTVFLTTHYMDEAQRLADRVTILRKGRIVAHGKPEELGKSLGATTIVRFRAPAGATLDELQAHLDERIELAGNEVELHAANPQRTLHKLTGWAESRGIQLEALEVQRPNLEDVFLEITGQPEVST